MSRKQAKLKLRPMVIRWRFFTVVGGVVLFLLVLVARTAYLQVISPEKLTHEGDLRSLRTETSRVDRGMILDRNGEELAVSVPVQAVWADPKTVLEKQGLADKRRWQALADVLKRDAQTLKERVGDDPTRRFVYLQRQVEPAVAQYIRKLHIPGIYLKHESRRFYPTGEVSAHIVGVTNIDSIGITGIEKTYNQWLTGKPGQRRVRKDRAGRVVEDLGVIQEKQSPQNLQLSIDQRIQSLAYQRLKVATTYYQATSGSVVVIDVRTGEILAMANTPSFNPNNTRERQSHRMRNRAIADTFEPGSAVKPIVALAALESGVADENTVVDTSPGWIRFGGRRVQDDHNNGKLTVRQILQKSSNVGITKLALQVGAENLLTTMGHLGFGNTSGSLLPGESSGLLRHQRRWSDFELATLSFGYGMTATPLQIAQAYAIIGAGGIKRQLSILKRDNVPQGEQAVPHALTVQLLHMLEAVVHKGGTAPEAQVPGYRVAGKTGTARKAIPGGYGDDYVVTFAGVAPVTNPRLAIAVVINEPHGDTYYAGKVAAPVFSDVMGGALQYLHVPPDDMSSTLAAGGAR